jgi:hypothetical protein
MSNKPTGRKYLFKLETQRIMSEAEYLDYKKIMPLAVNWKELERTGKTKATTHAKGEDVVSYLTLVVLTEN